MGRVRKTACIDGQGHHFVRAIPPLRRGKYPNLGRCINARDDPSVAAIATQNLFVCDRVVMGPWGQWLKCLEYEWRDE